MEIITHNTLAGITEMLLKWQSSKVCGWYVVGLVQQAELEPKGTSESAAI